MEKSIRRFQDSFLLISIDFLVIGFCTATMLDRPLQSRFVILQLLLGFAWGYQEEVRCGLDICFLFGILS
jgi:hypothetical protein